MSLEPGVSEAYTPPLDAHAFGGDRGYVTGWWRTVFFVGG